MQENNIMLEANESLRDIGFKTMIKISDFKMVFWDFDLSEDFGKNLRLI